MKKVLIFLLVAVLSLTLGGCGDTGSASGNAVGMATGVGTVITGAAIYGEANKLTNDSVDAMDNMLISMTNSELMSYAGQKVKGYTVLSFLARVEAMNKEEIFPIAVEIKYEDDLNEETINSGDYYKIELSDESPADKKDGYIDLATISLYVEDKVSKE